MTRHVSTIAPARHSFDVILVSGANSAPAARPELSPPGSSFDL